MPLLGVGIFHFKGWESGLLGHEAEDVSLMLLPKELGYLFLVWGRHGHF